MEKVNKSIHGLAEELSHSLFFSVLSDSFCLLPLPHTGHIPSLLSHHLLYHQRGCTLADELMCKGTPSMCTKEHSATFCYKLLVTNIMHMILIFVHQNVPCFVLTEMEPLLVNIDLIV